MFPQVMRLTPWINRSNTSATVTETSKRKVDYSLNYTYANRARTSFLSCSMLVLFFLLLSKCMNVSDP